MSDFAPWLSKAFRETFPTAIQGKCSFHMKQNIKKKFPKDFERLDYYLNLLCLATYEEEFNSIWSLCQKEILKEKDLKPIAKKFIEYFNNNYFTEETKNFYVGALPPGLGNTNNGLEGHHRYLKSQIFDGTIRDIGEFLLILPSVVRELSKYRSRDFKGAPNFNDKVAWQKAQSLQDHIYYAGHDVYVFANKKYFDSDHKTSQKLIEKHLKASAVSKTLTEWITDTIFYAYDDLMNECECKNFGSEGIANII